MKSKRILNLVFYKYYGNEETEKQACIFYADGTVQNVSFEDGIEACEEICRRNNIKTKDAFKEMINKNIVHVMSGKDFGEKFSTFLPTNPVLDEEDVESLASTRNFVPIISVPKTSEVVPVSETTKVVQPEVREEVSKSEDKSATPVVVGDPFVKEEQSGDAVDSEIEDSDFIESRREEIPVVQPIPEVSATKEKEKKSVAPKVAAAAATGVGAGIVANEVAKAAKKEDKPKAPVAAATTAAVANAQEDQKDEPKKGFFSRIIDRIKKNKLVKRILVCTTALAMGLGLYGCAAKKSLEGEMYRSNIPSMETSIDKDEFYTANMVLHRYNNDMYADYGYNQLLEVTHNSFQKQAMTNIRDGIVGFNDMFARNYVEDGVRPSLKWDEMVALQTAYNDYDKDQIKAYFNGAEIHSEDLSRAYKDASLQLMGAHAIETREHPVDMSMLIESDEGKEFYNRYHDLFLECKEATGDEKVEKVKEFYAMVRNDFPITEKVRTEGISHAENYEMLESYMLSVVPMISASEMMFQNLPKDVTLNDQEVEFFNDLGLCNRADKVFERIETITLTSEEDNKNPLYEQFRQAMIGILRNNDMYYVDDETRELTKLDAFQDAVNWHIKDKDLPKDKTQTSKPKTWTTTEVIPKVETHTETETTYHEEVTRVEKPIPADVKAQIDAELEAENAKAKAEAERKAEEERRRLQAEADREAARIQEEVRREEQDLQNKITDVNKQINQNNSDQNKNNDKPINESDFGDHGVQFDPQHQDGHGNLNDSVQNITTDPTGDMTNQPLPDPNQTGAAFDAQAPAYQSEGEPVSTTQGYEQEPVTQNRVEDTTVTTEENGWVESVPVADDYYYEDSWIEYGDTTNAEAVDAYVEGLANETTEEEGPYQYTK